MSDRAAVARVLAPALLLSGPVLAAAERAARPPAAPPAPEVRVQGYRVYVERVQQVENLAVDFPPEGSGKVTGQQVVSIHLGVQPPDPSRAANIQGLGGRVVALQEGNHALTLQTYTTDEEATPAGGVWRTLLMAQDVDLAASRLGRLQGELVVYPQARTATLDFPLTGRLPRTQEADGLRATLKQVRTRPGATTAVVSVEPAPGVTLARTGPESPYGITALTRAGASIPPSGGSSSGGARGKSGPREYSVTFTDLRETPARVRVQFLARSGTPKRIPFTLPDLSLPDTLVSEPEDFSDLEPPAPLRPGHPFYDAQGGTLDCGLRTAPADEGTLLVALSRREEAGWGPWRWVEAQPAPPPGAVLLHLRPGTYRVRRLWLPAGSRTPAAARVPVPSPRSEVVVRTGKSTPLPPMETGGGD